jgi:hypothetical protein
MRVADFLAIVNERALALLLEDLGAGCTARISSVWLWLHYHDKRVHYEVWLARKTGRIEIGLHFEGPREFSYHWAALMAPYMPEIQARLGPQVELEEWTASWARVHQTLPYDPLTEALADAVAHRLAEMITVLQPIVDRERENVPPELATMRALRPATPGARFKRRAASKRAHPA